MADSHLNRPVPSPGPSTATPSSTNTPDGVIFKSLSRAQAAYNSDEIYNASCKGIRLYIANDAAGGSTATAKIQVRIPSTSTWVDLPNATSSAVGSSTGTVVTIYPGLTGIADAAGSMINQHLGPSFRVVLTIGVATGTSAVYADFLL
jgi:hypothetical protein